MTIWCVKGIPDDRRMKVVLGADDELHFSTGGSINVANRLKTRLPLKEVVLPGKLPQEAPSLIINEISNPETHGEMLELCRQLCARYRCPVINRPDHVAGTTRDGVARKLAGIDGLKVPAVVRCAPRSPAETLDIAAANGIGTPFLIRETGKHGGNTLLRIEAGDTAGLLNSLAFDGREFYMTEYVDFRSPDGFYRKYRVVVVDGRAYLRQMIISSSWMIHAAQRPEMKQHPERMAEERFELTNYPRELRRVIQPIANAASRALKLDWFGMDCNFSRDREAVLFEANPNMNITRTGRAEMEPYIDGPIDALAELVKKRLKAARERTRQAGSRR